MSEVAPDWHELMIPQGIMRPSIARASEQLTNSVRITRCLALMSSLVTVLSKYHSQN